MHFLVHYAGQYNVFAGGELINSAILVHLLEAREPQYTHDFWTACIMDGAQNNV